MAVKGDFQYSEGRQAPLSNAQTMAQKLADQISFYDWMGRDQDANNLRSQLQGYNEQLRGGGLDPVLIRPLTDETKRQETVRYSRQGSTQAQEALSQYLMGADEEANQGRQEAIDFLKGQGGQIGAKWQALWDTVNGMLEDPVIDPKAQRMIEGGIRGEASAASRRFQESASENMGARVGMGRLNASGPGLETLAGFQGDLDRAMQDSLRSARIAQILENRQGEERMAQLLGNVTQGMGAEAYRYNSPIAQLMATPPSVMGATGLANMGELMAAYDAYKAADDSGGFMEDWLMPILGAAGPIVGSLFGPVGTAVGGAATGLFGGGGDGGSSGGGDSGGGLIGILSDLLGLGGGGGGGGEGQVRAPALQLPQVDPRARY